MAATAGQQPGLQIQVAGEVRDGSSLLSLHPTTDFTPPFQEHETNLYSMLGVPEDSEPEQIKWAYRRLLLQYHPDNCMVRIINKVSPLEWTLICRWTFARI